jgi:GMP synthase (glutamine-hydrolysing)
MLLVLDFGSQYTQLIARRIRELGVYCEIYPYDIPDSVIKKIAPQGIILSGGPQTVTSKKSARAPKIVFELGCPVLGICYGMQTMAAQLGGKVTAAKKREFGHANVTLNFSSKLFAQLKNPSDVWMSHGDKVNSLPVGFKAIASSDNTPYTAIENPAKKFYGVQFHPEVTHTKHGKTILKNFVYTICSCKKTWVPKQIINAILTNLQTKLGNDQVILGLSGGVDSSVAALLLHRAIGKNLICVFVDTGLLRLNEGEQLMKLFAQHFKMQVIRVNAEQRFLKALTGITDPERKRKIIGHEFIKVFSEQAKKLKGINWLGQGTIYPDVIESAQTKFSKAEVIKSHHNVGGLPAKMHLKLVEPLRELFKDEVRIIGKTLGLPSAMVNRHPFPGPGLGVRVIGEIKKTYLDLLRRADNIFIEELVKANLYHKVSQAFAVFMPIKSVGVMGDQRKYDYVLALRSVDTVDFMTANWSKLPHEFLHQVSNRIINEVPGISRVVYDISGKPPATIEWE